MVNFKHYLIVVLLAALLGGLGVFLWWSSVPSLDETGDETVTTTETAAVHRAQRREARQRAAVEKRAESAEAEEKSESEETEPSTEPETPLTEEERRADEEEKLVDSFDALTDKWMEPSSSGVNMADIKFFGDAFRKVPKARKEECLQRALNLVPDENVMLLAGVLMDKSQDKELLELVYNDILNRDEEVKQPILQQIYKDKEHPCWADTAWILDVTDTLPDKK